MRKTKRKHREKTRKTSRKPLTTRLKIKFFKSEFKKKEVKFLRYIVGREDIKSDLEKIRMLKKWSRFIKIKEIQSLMDFVNYYRKLVLELSKTVYLLNLLLKKKKK